MITYEVTLHETIRHRIEVQAANAEEATLRAKMLIGNEPDDVLVDSYSYRVDTVGWDGDEESEEVL